MHDEADLPTVSAVAGLRPTLARISLWTGDAARLEAFYADLFGFARVAAATLGPDGAGAAIVDAWKLPPGCSIRLVMLRAPRGGTELAIATVPGWPMPPTDSPRDGPPMAGMAYLALYVPDLDAVIGACRARDVPFNRSPKRLAGDAGVSYYEMAIYDPDGRVLLVVEDVTQGGA